MDRIIFGDNQFFGVNHLSEGKAREQSKKFKDTNSSLRLSFRENMAFIIGLSDHFLMKSANKWAKFDSNKKRTIKYVHYE